MKNMNFIFRFVLLLLTVIILSCHQEDAAYNYMTKREKIDIQKAGQWFDTNFNTNKIGMVPRWDKALFFPNAVEMPVEIEGRMGLPKMSVGNSGFGRQRAVVVQKDSKFALFTIKYVPSINFKGDIKLIHSGNLDREKFDGIITIQEFGSNKMQMLKVEQGVIKSTLKAEKNGIESNQRVECDIYADCTLWFIYVNGEYSYSDQTCDYFCAFEDNGDYSSNYTFPWANSGGGSSSGGGTENNFQPFNPTLSDFGNKPIFEYSNKCQGILDGWNNYPNNEVFGYITSDGQLLVINVLPLTGGETSGTYYYNGITYYPYPDTQGPLSGSYSGVIHSAGFYLIPVVASFHTHSPCRNDGSDGVSQLVSQEDKDMANQSQHINHWAIGCGATAQFDASNPNFYNKQTGQLSILCSNVQ